MNEWRDFDSGHQDEYLAFIEPGIILLLNRINEYNDYEHRQDRRIICDLYNDKGESREIYYQTFWEYERVLENGRFRTIHHPNAQKDFETRWNQIIEAPPRMLYDLWRIAEGV